MWVVLAVESSEYKQRITLSLDLISKLLKKAIIVNHSDISQAKDMILVTWNPFGEEISFAALSNAARSP
jgi:hypothetical protein